MLPAPRSPDGRTIREDHRSPPSPGRHEHHAGYQWAREHAKCALYDIDQISLGESLPETCPYTFDQILDEDWWPVWSDPLAERSSGEAPGSSRPAGA